MGGVGSGNHWRYGTRDTVESCRSIDVRRWRRQGYVPGPRWFRWSWTRDEETVATINVDVPNRNAVVLRYRYRLAGDEEWQPVNQTVPIEWTKCHLGGERPWFLCSVYRDGVYCGRRVAKLYAAGRLFACRTCYDLAYQSQNESPGDRAMTKAQKIRMQLGGSPSLMEPFPDKPKGMHWRTYNQLRQTAEEAELVSWEEVAMRFDICVPQS